MPEQQWMIEGGRRLRGRRVDLGLTVEQVAQAIGRDSSAVYRYEAGTSTPLRADVAPRYAAVLRLRSLSALYLHGQVEAL